MVDLLTAAIAAGVPKKYGKIFGQIGVADELVNRFKGEYPDKAELIDATYLICYSPIVHYGMPLTVFRAHVEQLIHAVIEGDDLNKPTMAEVAVMTCIASMDAPPDTSLAMMILGHEETMAAFGQEAQPVPEFTGDHYWPTLTSICRKVYQEELGDERAVLFARNLKERRQVIQRSLI